MTKPQCSHWVPQRKIVSRKDNRERRNRLFEKGRRLCHYCDRRLTYKTATLDHVVPLVKGGNDSDCNVVLACRECNVYKGNQFHLTAVQGDMVTLTIPTPHGWVEVDVSVKAMTRYGLSVALAALRRHLRQEQDS